MKFLVITTDDNDIFIDVFNKAVKEIGIVVECDFIKYIDYDVSKNYNVVFVSSRSYKNVNISGIPIHIIENTHDVAEVKSNIKKYISCR